MHVILGRSHLNGNIVSHLFYVILTDRGTFVHAAVSVHGRDLSYAVISGYVSQYVIGI